MANNYNQSSSLYFLRPEERRTALSIADAWRAALDADDTQVDVVYALEDEGLWIYGEESFNPEQAETLVRALQFGLSHTLPFLVQWATTCSKPRIDQFGGGSFLRQLGQPTRWLNTGDLAREAAPLPQSTDEQLAQQELAVLKQALADPVTLGQWINSKRIPCPQGYTAIS